jgi:hypothetical protein
VTCSSSDSPLAAALLAADASPWRAIGLKPERVVPLMNGNIPCRLLVFELYRGSRRTDAYVVTIELRRSR